MDIGDNNKRYVKECLQTASEHAERVEDKEAKIALELITSAVYKMLNIMEDGV